MRTGKYELVIIWATGDKFIYVYDSEEAAIDGQASMKMANGNQISWSCVRPQMA